MRWMVRKLVRFTAWVVGILWLVYSGAYHYLNDQRLGAFISARVNKVDRGTFQIDSVHYGYWGGFFSILFNTPTHVEGEAFSLRDPNGELVLAVPRCDTDVRMQELVFSLFEYAATGRFHLNLHFLNAHVGEAMAVIAPLAGSGEVNIIAAMSPKVVAAPGGGEFRIAVDDVMIDHAHFGIGFRTPDGSLSWRGKLVDARAQAGLVYSTAQELVTAAGPYFFFKVRADAPTGEVKLGAFTFPLEHIESAELGVGGNRREDLAFHGRAHTFGAVAEVDGMLAQAYSRDPQVALTLDVDHGARLLSFLPPPASSWLSGEPRGRLTLRGPFTHVVIDGDFYGGRARAYGVEIDDLAARLHFDRGSLSVEPSGHIAGGHVSARVDLSLLPPVAWHARVNVRALDPARLALLPPGWQAALGGRLEAHAKLAGRVSRRPEPVTIEIESAQLARERGGGRLPRTLTLAGQADWLAPKLTVKQAALGGDGLHVAFAGGIDASDGTLDAQLTADSSAGATWLHRLGAPDGVTLGAAHLRGTATGRLGRPKVTGKLSATDVAVFGRNFDELEADLAFKNGVLSASGLRGAGLGATLKGDASIALFDGELSRPLAQPTVLAHVAARGLGMAELTGWKDVSGTAEVSLDVDGPLADPHGHARFSLPNLKLEGDTYSGGLVEIDLGQGGAEIRTARLERTGGGTLSGRGRVGWDQSYDLTLTPHRFPIPAIPGVKSLPVPLDGAIGGSVRLLGSWENPQLEGELALYRFSFRSSQLGDGSLKWIPGGDATAILGRFFGDQFVIDGYVTLAPKATVVANVHFTDLALEKIVPELSRLAEMKGVASGEVRLSFSSDSGFYAQLRLPKVEIALQSTDEDGHLGRAVLKNRGDVLVASDGRSMRIDRADFESKLGKFKIAGRVAERDTDLKFEGDTLLELLEYFFRGAFNHTHGKAYVNLQVRGNPQRPDLTGFITVENANIEPRGMEEFIVVPAGRIDFTPSSLRVTDLSLTMQGETAKASGYLQLDHWKPGAISAHVDGELSPSLLRFVFDQVTEAQGRIGVSLDVAGHWNQPSWAGFAEIKEPLIGRLRNFPQEIRIRAGRVDLDNASVRVRGLVGTLDGNEVRASGDVDLKDGTQIARVDLNLSGSELAYETNEFWLQFTPRVRITGDHERLKLTGAIELNDGRYRQDWIGLQDLIVRPRVVEKTPPFWQGMPILETMALDVEVRTKGTLFMKNNIAEMQGSAQLRITGTLSDPRFDGNVRIDDGGTFNIPGARAPFVVKPSNVLFDPQLQVPWDTPSFDVSAVADLTDQYDTTHRIQLALTGPLNHMNLSLTSQNDNWDKQECLFALLTGRTPTQWHVYAGGGGSQGTQGSVADSIAKSATGYGIGNIISNPLERTFKFDQVWFEFSSGSIDLRACKRFGRMLKTCSYGEIGFSSGSQASQSIQARISDWLSGNLKVEYIQQTIPGTLQESNSRLRLELKVQIPLGY